MTMRDRNQEAAIRSMIERATSEQIVRLLADIYQASPAVHPTHPTTGRLQ